MPCLGFVLILMTIYVLAETGSLNQIGMSVDSSTNTSDKTTIGMEISYNIRDNLICKGKEIILETI